MAVIVAFGGSLPALAAIRATKTIPIIFSVAVDPVKIGLVKSLSHPGGNATGVANLAQANWLKSSLNFYAKWCQAPAVMGLLVNPRM